MLRRSFLKFLGLGPAAPAVAKEITLDATIKCQRCKDNGFLPADYVSNDSDWGAIESFTTFCCPSCKPREFWLEMSDLSEHSRRQVIRQFMS